MLKKIGYWILIIGLLGTVTNFIFVSPLPTLFSPLFIFIGFLLLKKPKKMTFWLALFFIYSTISVLLYHPESLLEFDFFRYDGNLYISYLPLLSFSFFAYDFNIEKKFKQFLFFSIIINIIGLVLLGLGKDGNYHGFFKAHNAVGGFMAFITIIAFVFAHQKKQNRYRFVALIAFVLLWLTGSRGSILGFLASAMFYFIYIRNYYKKLNIVFLVFFFIINFIASLYIYDTGLYTSQNLAKNGEKHMTNYIRLTKGQVSTKEMNVYLRIYWTWGRATNCFLVSPFFGTGFGSINDVPFNFKGIDNVLTINRPKEYIFNASHAHHSYFHFLGELGIIGFVIFIAFWWNVYKYIDKHSQNKIIQLILITSYFNLTIMSFTENRITTPSNALPFVITLCLYMLYINYHKKHAKSTS